MPRKIPRLGVALLLALAWLLAACGTTHHAAVAPACPQAANGHGAMGVCAPARVGLTAPGSKTAATSSGLVSYVDLSNNNPCDCGTAIRAAGHRGLIVKVNQSGYIDPTARAMITSTRSAGLAVGGYDFDQDYTVSEAGIFSRAAKQAGLTPHGRNEFPLTLDVEYGSFSYTGLLAQIHYLHEQGWRVDIYTGEWYWGPHAGARWPAGVPAWLSGYPNASTVPGLPSGLYHDHQYTSSGQVAGGHYGDVSVHFGTSFAAFVNDVAPKPKPRPKPAPKPRPAPHRTPAQERLAALIARQHLLRHLEAKHACKTRPRGYGACAHWLPEGQRVDREILNQPGGIT